MWRVCFTNDIKNVKVDDHKGEHGKTLLLIEMAEDARDSLFAFTV